MKISSSYANQPINNKRDTNSMNKFEKLKDLAKELFTYELATDIGHLLMIDIGSCVRSQNILLVKIRENAFSTVEGTEIRLSSVELPARIIRFN